MNNLSKTKKIPSTTLKIFLSTINKFHFLTGKIRLSVQERRLYPVVIERWLSSQWAVQFEHDGKMRTAGSVKGQSLPFIRKQLIEQEVAPFVKVEPFTLRQHFLQQGNVADANRVEHVHLSTVRVRIGRVVNEIAFAGASFIEGFLSVYVLELERAVKRYEDKLQLFEILEREQRKRSVTVIRKEA